MVDLLLLENSPHSPTCLLVPPTEKHNNILVQTTYKAGVHEQSRAHVHVTIVHVDMRGFESHIRSII